MSHISIHISDSDPSQGRRATAPTPPFGEKLREHRLATRRSQEELALLAGLSTRTVSDLERGIHTSARHHTAEALANALDLAPDEREAFMRLAVPETRRQPARPRVSRVLVREARRSTLRGRRDELCKLETAWSGALGGDARLVTVAGAAGIGKTRLLAEVARRADAAGAAVLYVRCDDALGDPYHAFVQLLRSYVEAVTPDTVVASDERDARHIATLLPELPVEPIAHGTRAELFDSIARTIERCARDAPCVLLFDDMQHADRATLHVLRHVMRHNAERRVLAVVAYRGYELAPDAPLQSVVTELSREMTVTRIALNGLSASEVAEIVNDRLGRPFPALARALHDDADGNPFFVSEYLAHLSALGKVDEQAWRRGGVVSENVGVPAGVRDVLASRISRVDDKVRDLLTYAAVIGVEFDVHLVAAMTAMPADRVFSLVDDAITAGLVIEDDTIVGRWHFAQPLFRSVLLDDLSHATRARLHQTVVETLERCGDTTTETFDVLAYHSTQAHMLPGMAERAVKHATRAAQDAARVFAWERAATLYERAVSVLEVQPDHDKAALCDLLLALGDARLRALERQHALPVFLRAAELAGALGSNDRLALAAIGYGYMAKAEKADARALALWDDALARTDDPALRAMLLAARATHMTFAGEDIEARATSAAALDLARSTNDVRALALSLAGRSITLWGTPESESRRVLAQELAACGILANNDEWLLDGIELVGVPLLVLARIEEFDRVVEDLNAAGRRTGHQSSVAQATQWLAMRALMRGEVDEARTLASRVIDLAENAPNFAMGYAAQRYAAERAVGAHDALLPALEDLSQRHPQVVAWRAAYARALAEAEQPLAAATVLDEIVARLPGAPRNWAWVAAVTVAAETAARLRAAPAAAVLEPLLTPYAGRLVVVASGTSCEGAVDRYRALLAATCGDDGTAAQRFEAALALEDGAGAPALTARTRLDFAALLRRAGTRSATNTARQLEAAASLDMDQFGLVHAPAIPR